MECDGLLGADAVACDNLLCADAMPRNVATHPRAIAHGFSSRAVGGAAETLSEFPNFACRRQQGEKGIRSLKFAR